MLAALRGTVRKVHVLGARDYFFDTPFKAWFFRNFVNVVPFDRDKNFLEGFRSCRQVLKRPTPRHVLDLWKAKLQCPNPSPTLPRIHRPSRCAA